MRDISLHLLDLAQNAIRAGAKHVAMSLRLSPEGELCISLSDDGCGMDEALLKGAGDPFVTSRVTRRVGLGIPLARANAQSAGGWLTVDSAPGQGCLVQMMFNTAHIDCLPLGALDQTVLSLIQMNPEAPEFSLRLSSPAGESDFDTAQIRAVLGPEVPLNEPEVISYLSQTLSGQLRSILGGIVD